MEIYKKIFENNQRWIKANTATNKNFFEHLAKGQNPEILYIGCSDSRVTAEEITGVKPGQMFVHRNIGNLVPNNDNNSASVIEFAVQHLQVKHIVVCGHYFCGGVKAAMESKDLGALNPWLRNIRDVYRLHREELNAIRDNEQRYKRLVELNVQEQCINIIEMGTVQRHYQKRKTQIVHGWVFDVQSGRLIDLNIDFDQKMDKIKDIYNLDVD